MSQGYPAMVSLLNTLKTLFRLSTVRFNRPLEIHSKRGYKICTCSVILGELESRWNYKGFNIIFAKILDAKKEKENFSDSSLHHIFESKNFRFPFLYELNSQSNLGGKMWKMKLQIIVGKLLFIKFWKLYMNQGTVTSKFLAVLK